MKTKIITHAGRAHRDDFLSVCWLIATNPDSEVERREPTLREIEDNRVFVIDCGGQHDPAKRNFDHHQLPGDAAPTCALQMLLESDLGKEKAHVVFPWLHLTAVFDSKGPSGAASELVTQVPVVLQLVSPVETAVLEMFAAKSIMNSNDTVFKMMHTIGEGMLRRALRFREAVSGADVTLASITDVPVLIVDPQCYTARHYPEYLTEVVRLKWRELAATGIRVAVSISPNTDSRGPGWVLYRFDDNANIDFARIKDHPQVTFAHANGFVAKVVESATLEELTALVQLSIVE